MIIVLWFDHFSIMIFLFLFHLPEFWKIIRHKFSVQQWQCSSPLFRSDSFSSWTFELVITLNKQNSTFFSFHFDLFCPQRSNVWTTCSQFLSPITIYRKCVNILVAVGLRYHRDQLETFGIVFSFGLWFCFNWKWLFWLIAFKSIVGFCLIENK